MKNLRGYLTAAILAGITYVLSQYGKQFSALIDMVYPYIIRTLEATLAQWSGQVPFLLWQLLAVALVIVFVAALVVAIVLKKNLIRWFGWVLAAASFVFMLHTMVYGLNYYAGDLSDDMRMEVSHYYLADLVKATEYYRDQANNFASRMNRDASGTVEFDDFDTLANRAGAGFDYLTRQRFYPVFAGSLEPVKKLGWADMYSSMGITGFTFPLTGEAAVNPQIPDVALPFTMCHEMAHRMCIASERDANFAGFLACSYNISTQFQYSAYFMAYRYCYNALTTLNKTEAAAAAVQINAGVNDYLRKDLEDYDAFFRSKKSEAATNLADSVNDAYLKASGEEDGLDTYTQVCDLLVNWHIQEVVLPEYAVEESKFDPYDETQVDLTGIVNARGQQNG